MDINKAIRTIAKNEPVAASEVDGSLFCIYCPGEGYPFKHEEECPWLYLHETVEEDDRITALLNEAYPGLFPPK